MEQMCIIYNIAYFKSSLEPYAEVFFRFSDGVCFKKCLDISQLPFFAIETAQIHYSVTMAIYHPVALFKCSAN